MIIPVFRKRNRPRKITFPNSTTSRDRFNSKCFQLDLVPLCNRWITESQLRKQPIDICFLVTKASRVSLQSKPPPFQVFPLATDRRPMILEQPITLAKLYQPTLFC